MDIPFALKFLKKVESFQDVKKLNKQFAEQIKSESSVLPLWEIEKKILFWSYKNHKHLGSPIKIHYLKSKKEYLLKDKGDYNSADINKAINKITAKDWDDKFEFHADEIKKLSELNTSGRSSMDHVFNQIKNIGLWKKKFGLSSEEAFNSNVRKVFGNLVSRGYAEFYPNSKREFDHWGSEENNMCTSVDRDVSVDQTNCDGILITNEGMLIGELLNNLYTLVDIKDENKKIPDDIKRYKNKSGAEMFLQMNFFSWFYYTFFIYVSYLALLLIICLIFKEINDLLVNFLLLF